VETASDEWLVQSFPRRRNEKNKEDTEAKEEGTEETEDEEEEGERENIEELLTEMYTVKRIRQKCPVKEFEDRDCNLICVECKFCAHIFTCTYVESSVKNNMCKHIHKVLLSFNTSSSITTVENMNSPPGEAIIAVCGSPLLSSNPAENFTTEMSSAGTSSTIVNSSTTQETNCENMREKLRAKFEQLLCSASSNESLNVIDKLLDPIFPAVCALLNRPQNLTSNDTVLSRRRKIVPQKRVFTSTKKKTKKKKNTLAGVKSMFDS